MAVEVAVQVFRLFVEVLDEGIDVVLWPRARESSSAKV